MFNSFRDELLKRELSNTENYDKAILTLSSATLGFSLSAVKFIVPVGIAEYINLLKLSWIFLTLSVLFSLCAYLISNKAISVQLDNARDYYINSIDDAFTKENRFIAANKTINIATGLLFGLSVILTVAFISLNIEKRNSPMTKDIKTLNDSCVGTVKKAANIPSMERLPSDRAGNSANVPTMESVPSKPSQSPKDSESKD